MEGVGRVEGKERVVSARLLRLGKVNLDREAKHTRLETKRMTER